MLIYVMTVPMIPAALIAALAIVRLGAIHAAVFGGFASASLAQRIDASKPRAIMTASCGIEGSKGVVDYKPLVEGAVEQSSWKPSKVIVWQRSQLRWAPMNKREGQRNWNRIVKSGRGRGVRAAAVPVASNDPLYIIYTSGKSCTLVWQTTWIIADGHRNYWLAQRRGSRSRWTRSRAQPVRKILV